jgi:alkanesulfonate monooxygenase SsuD/methylene tetrahydromethanopterin reductase-like flavin-dependent oxidoreductase (luciferase family)
MAGDAGLTRSRAIGVLYDRSHRPTDLPSFVRQAELMPLDDVWFVEDVGWAGSVAQTATALAHSQRLRIGMGMCPVPLRNPVLHAMELAGLAELYPERLVAGVGHGTPHRMVRVARPVRSRLTQLETALLAIRALLAGKSVTVDEETIRLDDARLEHIPPVPPPLYIGAVGPRTLALSGRIADGTILAEGTTPAVLRRDLAHIGSDPTVRPHEIVVYVYVLVHGPGDDVRPLTGPIIEKFAVLHSVPPEDGLVAAGSAESVAEQVEALWAAGANTVVLRPIGEEPLGQVASVLRAIGR